MQIEAEQTNGTTLLRIGEERIDAHNSSELKQNLQKFLENGTKALAVDLSAVRFIDSSGLGALLSAYKNANLRQRSLVLVGLQPRVQSMFELTRLNRVFTIFPSLEEALQPREGEEPDEPDSD